MKETYTIHRDEIRPPIPDIELALFTFMLQSTEARAALGGLGIVIPERFEAIHNTGKDDPPDIEAFGLGFECTEFPPNQSAIHKVHNERGPSGMILPGFSETGDDIRKIRELAEPSLVSPRFYTAEKEAEALAEAFCKIIDGPRSKDVPGNDVLLLDYRREILADMVVELAIRGAIARKRPTNIRLILLISVRAMEAGDLGPRPRVAPVYP